MREQLRSLPCAGGIFAGGKNDVVSYRVGSRLQGLCRALRALIRVDSHLTEVATEARPHKFARGVIEWLSGSTQHILHDYGHAIQREGTTRGLLSAGFVVSPA